MKSDVFKLFNVFFFLNIKVVFEMTAFSFGVSLTPNSSAFYTGQNWSHPNSYLKQAS